MKLLHLDSSILGDNSVSRQLSREVVEAYRLAESQLEVRYRDLTEALDGHLSGTTLAAKATPAELRSAEQKRLAQLAHEVMDEFLAADVLVLGAPMYNLSIPSQLKTWIDLVTVAGVTFRYGPNGPEGLVKGKRAVIVATAGGQHAGTPSGVAHIDYLRLLLGFLGITEVSVIAAEGLAMGPTVREPALQAARQAIDALAVETV